MKLALNVQMPVRRSRRRAVASSAGSTRVVFNRYLLNIDFEAPGGEQWSAVGGGETVADAIVAARDALPFGYDWDVVRWNHLYGD